MARVIIEIKPRKCKACESMYTMEDVGLDPSNARHRLRFRHMQTCGEEDCVKKARGEKPKHVERERLRRAKMLTKRTEEDNRLEAGQYMIAALRSLHPDLMYGMQEVSPSVVAYRRMMGRM